MTITSINDVTKLNNGVLMPRFGLGVWKAKGQEVVDAVTWLFTAMKKKWELHFKTAESAGRICSLLPKLPKWAIKKHWIPWIRLYATCRPITSICFSFTGLILSWAILIWKCGVPWSASIKKEKPVPSALQTSMRNIYSAL